MRLVQGRRAFLPAVIGSSSALCAVFLRLRHAGDDRLPKPRRG